MSAIPNHFELFELPVCFDIDLSLLAERYRDLQRLYHPDRHADKSSQDVRVAVQKAAWVNQAYDVLKSPVSRAYYLLELNGAKADGHSHITRDSSFLMDQMELRERLQEVEDEADPFAALATLGEETQARYADLQGQFANALAMSDLEAASDIAAKMQFFAKFLREVDEVEERLDA